MENNFEEKRKDVDLSSIDIDAQSFDRKLLELNDRFRSKFIFEEEAYAREFSLANNYEDEIQKRTRISAINSDFRRKMDRILDEYEKELAEVAEKFERKTDYPYYFKWRLIGDTSSYNNLLNGLSYYIKQMSKDKIRVYSDVKFNTYLGEFNYVASDWTISEDI